MTATEETSTLVIASGDEGLQLNVGTRFGFVGSGWDLPHFDQAIKTLQKKLPEPLVLASIQEDDWLNEKLQTKNPNLYQEKLQQFATDHHLAYIGQLDYGDPRDLSDGVTRGHLVRPPKIHVADQICFTTGGGEQQFNLRQIMISADYLFGLKSAAAAEIIGLQIKFYQKIIGRPLKFSFETAGILGENLSQKNYQALLPILTQFGYQPA